MRPSTPIASDIVLLGGGHAHVHVLAAFGKRPLPGVRLTLVTRDLETPYSGMMPGVIAGLYTPQEAHIDLVKLAGATGTRLIHAEVTGLERATKRVRLKHRPPIAYDLISVDVGITPALATIAGASTHAIAVKPIGLFLDKLDRFLEHARRVKGSFRVAVIGGGAGGVEILLSLRTRLLKEAAATGRDTRDFTFCLITQGEILDTHNVRVRAAFRRILHERGIVLHENVSAKAIHPDAVELADGRRVAADCILITTQAAPPPWFGETGLALDPGGFLAVGPTLQALNDPDVFAAGDCAALVETPREKAGVYAVRAGPPLARNLRLRAQSAKPKPWYPQRTHLALISSGERYAIASRGGFKAEGAWLWTLKDWIDRRWMRMYQDAERMAARMIAKPAAIAASANEAEAMRCGGCAAKVGPAPLARALSRLDPVAADGVVLGLGAPDDAAVFEAPEKAHLVQTIDFFRSFIDDPYLFGQIASAHALNDIFAMGGHPRYALANAVIPHAGSAKVEEELFQLLSGARACLDHEKVALTGGHSSEGSELAFGLAVTGEINPERIVRKGGLRNGDALILTKPLGTGILFAAAMRAKAPALAIGEALEAMRQSGRAASEILMANGVSAMTDVTGFGLAGHLGEMLAASGRAAEIDLAALPLYRAVGLLARAGVVSTLLKENLALGSLLEGAPDDTARAVLFDPQTSGGLLAGVSEERAGMCVNALRDAGYLQAALIGRVTEDSLSPRQVRIAIRGALSD